MKESHREWTFRYLNDNEPYGWLEERCARIAAGAPYSHCWRDYCLSGSAFKQWILQRPARQERISQAMGKQAELHRSQRQQERVSAVHRRETVKIYIALEQASTEVYEAVGRLLKVNLPPRPRDLI